MGAVGLASAFRAPQPASRRVGLRGLQGPGTAAEALVLPHEQGVDARGKLKSQ